MNIPTYEETKIATKEGVLTDVWRSILIQLLQQLGVGVGKEGFQLSQVTGSQKTTIEGNRDQQGNFTCQLGTLIYNSTTNTIMAAIDDGTGVPIFKTVTLT